MLEQNFTNSFRFCDCLQKKYIYQINHQEFRNKNIKGLLEEKEIRLSNKYGYLRNRLLINIVLGEKYKEEILEEKG